MTEEQFYEGDADLARVYREADELRQKRENQRLWLQGLYVYNAVLDLVPVLHAFAGKGAKPEPYPSEPYPLTEKEVQERKEAKEKEHYEKMFATMQAAMAAINKKQRGDENGSVGDGQYTDSCRCSDGQFNSADKQGCNSAGEAELGGDKI